MRRLVVIATVALIALTFAAAASAKFPYTRAGADPTDYNDLYLGAGQTPSDLTGKLEWMYAATPEPDNQPVNSDPTELNGVRGSHLVDDDASVEHRLAADYRTSGCDDRGARLRDQVERRRRDEQRALQDQDRQGRGAAAAE